MKASSASIQAFNCSYKNDLVESYQNLSSLCNFSSKRTDCDWDWLLGHATYSYYFYKPSVVLDEKNANFVGYFTHDPNDPGRPREVVYQPSLIIRLRHIFVRSSTICISPQN